MRQPSAKTRRWTDWVWRLYECAPSVLEDAARWCVPLVLPWLALRVPVAILRGPSPYSGRPWVILMAGSQPAIDNVSHRFFACPPQREVVGSLPLWRLPSTLKRLGASADLVIARVDRLSARLFFRTPCLVVPESVGSWLAVPDDLNKAARANHSLSEDLRRIRREKLALEVSHTQPDCEVFYHTMYVPYLRKRHGELAIVRNLPQMRRAFRRGGILWVLRDGQRVAGGLFYQRNDVLYPLAVGTAGGDFTLTKKGALAAVYFFYLQYAHSQRCTRIDFGGSPPVLNDGLLRYKCKWGARLTAQSLTHYDYLMRWERPNEQVIAFLAHRSLIFRRHGQLAAVTALESGNVATPDLVRQIHCSLSIPGLQRLFIISSGWKVGNRILTQQTLEQPRAGHESDVVLCDADHFLQEFGGVG